MQRWILGTAQWGLEYGATNDAGRLDDVSVLESCEVAREYGLRVLDTAPAYGNAESRIGQLGLSDFGLNTKGGFDSKRGEGISESLAGSLARLKRSQLEGFLVHNWSELGAEDRLAAARSMEEMRAKGLVSRVGVSIYSADELEAALEAFSRLDLVQVPASILDQRLVGASVITRARSGGTRIQARSIFLQGAALSTPDHPLFGAHADVVRLRSAGRSPLELCVSWVAAQDWIDEVVVGVTSARELTSIMDANLIVDAFDFTEFASQDPWLVNPRGWTSPTQA